MAGCYRVHHQVQYYECDQSGSLSLPMILNLAVLSSKEQGYALGVGDPVHFARGLGWVILQYDVTIHRRPRVGEQIMVETLQPEFNPFFVARPYIFTDIHGNELITIESLWAMIDVEKRRMVKVPLDIIGKYEPVAVRKVRPFAKPERLVAGQERLVQTYPVRYLNIDANQHVNNAAYAEWLANALPDAFLDVHEPVTFTLKYESEIVSGAVVTVESTLSPDGTASQHRMLVAGRQAASAAMTWQARAPRRKYDHLA